MSSKILLPVTDQIGSVASARKVSKPKAAVKSTYKKPSNVVSPPPTGYGQNPGGSVLVQNVVAKETPVPASKLKQGMATAQIEISRLIHELAETMTTDFEITEMELAMSFNAKGEFMGFGVSNQVQPKTFLL